MAAKARKHLVCRECAIIASGIRTGAKIIARGDKKTEKQRREKLQQAPVQDGFTYFDADPGTERKQPQIPEPLVAESPDPEPQSDLEPEAAVAVDSPSEIDDASTAVDDVIPPVEDSSDPWGSDDDEPDPAVFDDERPGDEQRNKTSAIDQLDLIRETGAATPEFLKQQRSTEPSDPEPAQAPETVGDVQQGSGDSEDPELEQTEFRKPRPFIRATAPLADPFPTATAATAATLGGANNDPDAEAKANDGDSSTATPTTELPLAASHAAAATPSPNPEPSTEPGQGQLLGFERTAVDADPAESDHRDDIASISDTPPFADERPEPEPLAPLPTRRSKLAKSNAADQPAPTTTEPRPDPA
ncbi:MAG: hypothetical protein ACR2QK_13790, partial [Acidimicrobiales bacterium]